ncbi:hypothetical protein FHS42_001923 [Streptomyces zagrosensis]|uniref:Uncharacterized protein n=1 Tax=Streptomyces zagrosensis TaxID=1042984 RepID=A0A7W9Q7Z7_9ACTN|nr:hypothetical protein [Streptomyces zagrosensis]
MSERVRLNLVTPRGGQVDPRTCIQCAQLLKDLIQASGIGDHNAVSLVLIAMDVHMTRGHPEDTR